MLYQFYAKYGEQHCLLFEQNDPIHEPERVFLQHFKANHQIGQKVYPMISKDVFIQFQGLNQEECQHLFSHARLPQAKMSFYSSPVYPCYYKNLYLPLFNLLFEHGLHFYYIDEEGDRVDLVRYLPEQECYFGHERVFEFFDCTDDDQSPYETYYFEYNDQRVPLGHYPVSMRGKNKDHFPYFFEKNQGVFYALYRYTLLHEEFIDLKHQLEQHLHVEHFCPHTDLANYFKNFLNYGVGLLSVYKGEETWLAYHDTESTSQSYYGSQATLDLFQLQYKKVG
jgi:hypothetical protein